MNGDRRARAAAVATVIGLAGLGGVALRTNHGMVPSSGVAGVGIAGGRAPVVTGASGSTTTGATGPSGEARRNPIVTRTSAAGAGASVADD